MGRIFYPPAGVESAIAPFTFDQGTTHRSIEELADLGPKVVAAGHGLPIAGDHVAAELRGFAGRFTPLRRGRYVAGPPRAGEWDIEWLPPPVPDPYARSVFGAAMATAAFLAIARRRRRKR